jgi:hypothetical protein
MAPLITQYPGQCYYCDRRSGATVRLLPVNGDEQIRMGLWDLGRQIMGESNYLLWPLFFSPLSHTRVKTPVGSMRKKEASITYNNNNNKITIITAGASDLLSTCYTPCKPPPPPTVSGFSCPGDRRSSPPVCLFGRLISTAIFSYLGPISGVAGNDCLNPSPAL